VPLALAAPLGHAAGDDGAPSAEAPAAPAPEAPSLESEATDTPAPEAPSLDSEATDTPAAEEPSIVAPAPEGPPPDGPSPDGPSPDDATSWLWQPEKPRFALALGAGYALRVHEDERSHGAAAQAGLEVPLAWGFGVDLLGYGMGWGPTPDVPSPLGLVGGAASLLYAFDDTDNVALVGIGPTVAAGLEQTESGEIVVTSPYVGAMLELKLRMPLGFATGVEAIIRAPIYLFGPDGFALRAPFGNARGGGQFPSQFSLSVGFAFEPMAFFDASRRGADLFDAILPLARDD